MGDLLEISLLNMSAHLWKIRDHRALYAYSKALKKSLHPCTIRRAISTESTSQIKHKSKLYDTFGATLAFRSSLNTKPIPKLAKLVCILIFGGLLLHEIYDLAGAFQYLNVEEFQKNTVMIEAQKRSKEAKSRGEAPISKVDDFMASSPDLKPEKGLRIRTPAGHFAYYNENEDGEPFLMDDNNNLWIWAGADVNDPTDDWLVRTSEGDIYNYYIDERGKLRQKLLGNEKDLKAIPHTNLGTIVGFANDDIDGLHYRALPFDALKIDETPTARYLFPPLIEEGFMEFQTKNHFLTRDLSRKKLVEYDEIERSVREQREQYQTNSDPFTHLIDVEEEIIGEHVQQDKSLTKRAINASSIPENSKTVKGAVADLPSALDYSNVAEVSAFNSDSPYQHGQFTTKFKSRS